MRKLQRYRVRKNGLTRCRKTFGEDHLATHLVAALAAHPDLTDGGLYLEVQERAGFRWKQADDESSASRMCKKAWRAFDLGRFVYQSSGPPGRKPDQRPIRFNPRRRKGKTKEMPNRCRQIVEFGYRYFKKTGGEFVTRSELARQMWKAGCFENKNQAIKSVSAQLSPKRGNLATLIQDYGLEFGQFGWNTKLYIFADDVSENALALVRPQVRQLYNYWLSHSEPIGIMDLGDKAYKAGIFKSKIMQRPGYYAAVILSSAPDEFRRLGWRQVAGRGIDKNLSLLNIRPH